MDGWMDGGWMDGCMDDRVEEGLLSEHNADK